MATNANGLTEKQETQATTFIGFTGADRATATTFLKECSWNSQVALDRYFSDPDPSQFNLSNFQNRNNNNIRNNNINNGNNNNDYDKAILSDTRKTGKPEAKACTLAEKVDYIKQFKEIGGNKWKPSKEGEIWYAISKTWLTLFLDDETANPGCIDNSRISRINRHIFNHEWEIVDKIQLKEHITHEWICKEKWDFLKDTFDCYGLEIGGAILSKEFKNDAKYAYTNKNENTAQENKDKSKKNENENENINEKKDEGKKKEKKEESDFFMYSIGGTEYIKVGIIFVNPNMKCWKLTWDMERLLWIGHLKNDNDGFCLFSNEQELIVDNINNVKIKFLFAKHLITYILSFLNRNFDKKYSKKLQYFENKCKDKHFSSNFKMRDYKLNKKIFYFPNHCTIRDMSHFFGCKYDPKSYADDRRNIHVWTHFENIGEVYTIDKRGQKVTFEHFKNENRYRFVEIPDDVENKTLLQIQTMKQNFLSQTAMFRLTKKSEKSDNINVDENKDDNKQDEPSEHDMKDNVVDSIDMLTFAIEYQNDWDNIFPLMKRKDEWIDHIQIGDIFDVIDAQNVWYECYVRNVHIGSKTKTTDEQNEILSQLTLDDDDMNDMNDMKDKNKEKENGVIGITVHFIGWATKWVEYINIIQEFNRIKYRNTESKCAHRPRNRPSLPLMYRVKNMFELSVQGMQLNDNIQAKEKETEQKIESDTQ